PTSTYAGHRLKTAVVVVLLTLAVSACARHDAPPPKDGALAGANVLLVTIDTLRRDRLGSYGNPNGLTPALDRLGAAAVRFTRAYSHVPMTLPAPASILTGRTPPAPVASWRSEEPTSEPQ